MIIIDQRENDLYLLFKEIYPEVEIRMLDIGDIHICNENGELLLCIERKSITDVAASITDGRWNEQKLRAISNYSVNRIMYMIEISSAEEMIEYLDTNMNTEAIYSSIVNLWIKDNIPYLFVWKKINMVKHIIKLHDQYMKYIDNPYIDKDTRYEHAYIRSIQTQKKKNMDEKMYYTYCLSGIPGVSIILAKKIQEIFFTFREFINYIQENNETEFTNKYFSLFKKKINKNVVKNIYDFFS